MLLEHVPVLTQSADHNCVTLACVPAPSCLVETNLAREGALARERVSPDDS